MTALRLFRLVLALAAVAGLAALYLISAATAEAAASPRPKAPAARPPGQPPPPAQPPVPRPPLPRPGKPLPPPKPVVLRRLPAPVVIQQVTDLPAPPVIDGRDSGKEKACKVLRVAEDLTLTVDMGGREATGRLLGIEAAADPDGQAGSGPAARFLRNLVLGEFVYLAYDPVVEQQDEVGAYVAYVYRAPDRLCVNLELVRQGFAVAATDYEYQHQKTFAFYERKARADDKGLWERVKQAEAPAPPPAAPALP